MSDERAWTASAPYARAINDPSARLVLHADTGEHLVLDAAKFSAPPDAVDKAVLDRCQGPTLDLGCGPGRLVAELAGRGVPALGVDVAPFALLLSRANGASALRRSVFDRLPGAGRWPHALLMDGNIGIGGDPGALLDRLRTLIRPGVGELIVETEAEDIDLRYRVRFGFGGDPVNASAGPSSSPSAGSSAGSSASPSAGVAPSGRNGDEFGWARIGSEALMALAIPLGYVARHMWTADSRRFVALNYLA
ncbi:SAM-dependent methyltransferase [Catenulispora sp. NF23]|uniref:class I SAM-dependent methyltransferase n=1 Tax=Catenulispora pinistramenti TaxID=2705254 RepID=UPI001BA8F00F|nr:class I SAM-dependent methyltransferase [Catenulispora pinistramenti]MBS2533279.1 SAM-dependent methyltransferase [Catenulispora pinistramenti]